MFELGYPWLALLLPLPLLFRQKSSAHGAALRHLALYRFSQQQQSQVQAPKDWSRWLRALCWSLLVLAATQPRWLGDTITLPQQGRDLMLAVDLSGSMDITDMQNQNQAINRLDAVKLVLNDFIQKRQGDRLGLILFGDAAYQQTPLTYDLTTVRTMLDESVRGLAGERTAIGEAIGLAVKRLNSYETSNKVLILLSDGANTAGVIQPLEALQLAKAAGVKIYTVGVGAEQMVQESIFGRQLVNPSQDLDEALLTQLASETGGRYFRARDLKELAGIYQLLDQLEPVERDQVSYRPQQSLLHYPLLAALLLMAVLALRQIQLRRQSDVA
ncbi:MULTISPECIES: vWA domain-containing protein [Rheinheimera]|uniref:VWA domain-containing protein n=1 Tax=Rheinheimera marina TaxID=1774958 RepID=A0ABV9JQ65_9GAMM